MNDEDQLHQTALEVIRALKRLSDYSNLRIVVIGGLARMRYSPRSRHTKNVDFFIHGNSQELAEKIRLAIVGLGDTDFRQRTDILYRKVKVADGPSRRHRVSFIGSDMCPYLPSAAKAVQDIAEGEVPFISCEDLAIFKIHCCGLRGNKNKAKLDARDAMVLLNTMDRPLELSPQQQSVVDAEIDTVLKYCPKKGLSWWRKKLGLPGDCAGNGEDDKKEGDMEEDSDVEDMEEEGDAEETEEEGGVEGMEEDGDAEETEEGNVEDMEEDNEEEDTEEDGEEDNTFLDSSSSIRFSFFGLVFLVMGRVRIAGVVN